MAGASLLAPPWAQAAAAAVEIQSPLPDYPHLLGVQLVHDGSVATASRERAVGAAERRAAGAQASGSRAAPSAKSLSLTASTPTPACPTAEDTPGQDLCWWGGPVLREYIVHLIFWEGTEGEHHSFSPAYIEAIENYFEDVVRAIGSPSDVYAVSSQYGDQNGPGENKVVFERSEDVYRDTEHALPTAGTELGRCTDQSAEVRASSERHSCVTHADYRHELEAAQHAIEVAQRGPHARNPWDFDLENVYFVLTPRHVGGCTYGAGEDGSGEANACALAPGGYCGYHSFFEPHSGRPALYAAIPYDASSEGCETYEEPNGSEDVDATLATISHEHNEIVTDPLGTGWHDQIGQEEVDKCEPPDSYELIDGIAGAVFGGPLGGTLPTVAIEDTESRSALEVLTAGSLYNQVIGGGHYMLPTVWSNAATFGGGRCVQRVLPATFSVTSAATATVPTTFDGAASGEAGDPADYWVWTFGDAAAGSLETQVGTGQPTVSHTYAAPGNYVVTLTAYDSYGNSAATDRSVTVAPAPVTTTTTTTRATISAAPIRYSAAGIATLIGLPRNGSKLSVLRALAIGHGKCPPACAVSAGLYTDATPAAEGRKATKAVLIGRSYETIDLDHELQLTVALNASGRRLLRAHGTLAVTLRLALTDEMGGGWQLVRRYTLAAAARHSSPGTATPRS
jgi:hypothetical protein